MKIEFYGQTKAAQQIRAAAQNGPVAAGKALYIEAEIIMAAAKTDYVPVDNGILKGTGYVTPPEFRGNQASVELGFGGPAAPYAVIVHEDLTIRHKVGQAKYLEIPLRARLAGMPSVIAMRVADAIRQAFQRLRKIEQNVGAGRPVNWGMPLFR